MELFGNIWFDSSYLPPPSLPLLQRFRRLIKKGDYITAMAVARKQVEEGAMILDLNVDDGMIDGVKAMGKWCFARSWAHVIGFRPRAFRL